MKNTRGFNSTLKHRKHLKRKPLRRVSKKRMEENFTYQLAVEEWRAKRINVDGYFRCEFKGQPFFGSYQDEDSGRCALTAMHAPHHRKLRGKWLAHPRYFMAACFHHHRWIHDHANEARKRRYLLR